MKGIILAGGSGTRLYPLTIGQSKQLLAIHDKPMIYYPLSVLMLAGIRDILIISTPQDLPNFKRLLSDGSQIGMNFSYASQEKPNGIAEAFIIGEKFIGNENVCLILGDNIFYGSDLKKNFLKISNKKQNSIIGYQVSKPQNYGVINVNKRNKILSIEEKPRKPNSNLAATGIYFYENYIFKYLKKIKPSKRGELEITDLNNILIR